MFSAITVRIRNRVGDCTCRFCSLHGSLILVTAICLNRIEKLRAKNFDDKTPCTEL